MSDIVERLTETTKHLRDATKIIRTQADEIVWLRQEPTRLQAQRDAEIEHRTRVEAERDRLRALLTEVCDSWDWWSIDPYDRCSTVVGDAVREARAALGATP